MRAAPVSHHPQPGSRQLSPVEKRRVVAGGAWCEKCEVVHPMSHARGAVPGTCQECKAFTTDIHLISVVALVDDETAIGLVLACSCCARRGINVDLAELFGVEANRVKPAPVKAQDRA